MANCPKHFVVRPNEKVTVIYLFFKSKVQWHLVLLPVNTYRSPGGTFYCEK